GRPAGIVGTLELPAARAGAAASRVRAATARRRRETRPRAAQCRAEAYIDEIAPFSPRERPVLPCRRHSISLRETRLPLWKPFRRVSTGFVGRPPPRHRRR